MLARLPKSISSNLQKQPETVRSLPINPTSLLIKFVYIAIDALIVGIQTQDVFLGNKKTWTRKIIILTDGESPIEVEDWEATVKKMTALNIILIVVCVPSSKYPQ